MTASLKIKEMKILHDLIFDHFQIWAFSQLTANTTLKHPFKASSKEKFN
jgi:hypothetical protein